MRRTPRILLAAMLLAILASSSHADGVNLSWNDCGVFGQANHSFACDTNDGYSDLVISYVSPVSLPRMYLLRAQFDIVVQDATLPKWWNFVTRCRPLPLGLSIESHGLSCFNPWPSISDLQAFPVAGGVPNGERVTVFAGLSAVARETMSINAETEYYAFDLLIRNYGTVGPSACDGCSTPACINLDSIQLFQLSINPEDPPPPGVTLTQPVYRASVGWQCPSLAGQCSNFCPVPNQRPTWGGIKSLYR